MKNYTWRRCQSKRRKGGYGCGCGSQGCPIAPFPMKSGGKRQRRNRTCGKRQRRNRTCGKRQRRGCTCGKRGCKHCRICTKRSRGKRSRGGNFYKQGAPVPPPFVGAPWTGNSNTWPGYGESNNHGNHFAQNMYNQDPKMMMQLGGKSSQRQSSQRQSSKRQSRRKTRKLRKRRGGASFLQNAANSYRDLEYNFKSAYNAASGYEPPVNPLPYKDQLQPRQM